MAAIAIITARGGSKRIPRKNIKEFAGKPILAYSIEAALKSGLFEEVMVSTDDEEIGAIAEQYGAKVPFYRGETNSGDFAGTADVLIEVLTDYRRLGRYFDTVCCIYPTAPFVTAKKLQDAFAALEAAQDADTLIPVVQFSYPPQRAYGIVKERLQFLQPQYMTSRSQDLEPMYHDAGQFYLMRTTTLLENKSLSKGVILPMVVDELEVQDIDNLTDWKLAEMKYRMMIEKE